jgi:hypothetical protein
MKNLILVFAATFFAANIAFAQMADESMINLTRKLSEDLFEYNGAKYAQPIVQIANASTNARFFNEAFVPQKVDKPYYRFSLNGMLGFVGDDLKSFEPKYPMREFKQEDLNEFIESMYYKNGSWTLNIRDTVGLYEYLLLNMIWDGVNNKVIKDVPERLPTALGTKEVSYLNLPLDTLIKRHELYEMLPEDQIAEIEGLLKQFPSRFPLTSGSDISTLALGVPQFEIGSLYGTELLIRFIPPIDIGKTFGDFSFWGIGLKHSISQHFNPSDDDRYFDLAIQGVYQRTHLKNYIGVTNAELTADANIYNINIHGSKEFNDWFSAYAGISYEAIEIAMDYLYYIPVEIQRELGMIEQGHEKPTPGYPGDQNPQLTEMDFTEEQIKFAMGVKFDVGDFDMVADYSFSKFNLFSFGVRYTLHKPE